MGRKPVLEGGKKDEIIKAATELFFEKGYEGTSVRMIQKRVGSEIGLFYYYFKSKDEIFDIAIYKFMDRYHEIYREVINKGKENPEHVLITFFEGVKKAVGEFQDKYAGSLHWSVRRAIREKGLEMMCPYVEECLSIMKDSGIKFVDVSEKTLITVISYGIGGAIIHGGADISADEMKDFIFKLI